MAKRKGDEFVISEMLSVLSPSMEASMAAHCRHWYHSMWFQSVQDRHVLAFLNDLEQGWAHDMKDVLFLGQPFRFGQRIHVYVCGERMLSFLNVSDWNQLEQLFRVHDVNVPLLLESSSSSSSSSVGSSFKKNTIFALVSQLVKSFPSDIPGARPFVTLHRDITVQHFLKQVALCVGPHSWSSTSVSNLPMESKVYQLTIELRFAEWTVIESTRRRIQDVLTFFCQPYPFMKLESTYYSFQTSMMFGQRVRSCKVPWFGCMWIKECTSCQSSFSRRMRTCSDCGMTGLVWDDTLLFPQWSELPIGMPQSNKQSFATWSNWEATTLRPEYMAFFCQSARPHGTIVECQQTMETVIEPMIQKLTEIQEEHKMSHQGYQPKPVVHDSTWAKKKLQERIEMAWARSDFANGLRRKEMMPQLRERWDKMLFSFDRIYADQLPSGLRLLTTQIRFHRDKRACIILERDTAEESTVHPRCSLFALTFQEGLTLASVHCLAHQGGPHAKTIDIQLPAALIRSTYDDQQSQMATHLLASLEHHMSTKMLT